MNCTNCGANIQITKDNIPAQYRPLSAWAYFGYSLLFSIPVVGFILLIVFSFNRSNLNRRSFARSYFCSFILVLVFMIILVATGATAGILGYFNS